MSMAKINGKEIAPHCNGPWNLEDGMFIHSHGACTNDPAIYIDKEDGTLLKFGDAQMVKSYVATHINSLIEHGFTDMAKGLTVIEFDRYPDAKLTADEICTLINYLNNCLGPERVQELFTMSENDIKAELKKLYEIGF